METIIAATDFSKPANNAAAYAAQLAKFLNTRLVLVHAIPMPVGGYDMTAPLSTFAGMKGNADQRLQELKEQLIRNSYDSGISYHSELGSVQNIIHDVSEVYDADLIVMGMTGEAGALKQQIIGSNTLKAARNLRRPLLVIPEGVTYKPIRHICLAADTSHLSDGTLIYSARDIAQLFNAELELVTVEPPSGDEKWQAGEVASFVESRLHTIRHKRVILREDSTATALEYYFKFHDTDLVIVHPEKHTLFQKLFSERITKRLVYHTRVPLLVLH